MQSTPTLYSSYSRQECLSKRTRENNNIIRKKTAENKDSKALLLLCVVEVSVDQQGPIALSTQFNIFEGYIFKEHYYFFVFQATKVDNHFPCRGLLQKAKEVYLSSVVCCVVELKLSFHLKTHNSIKYTMKRSETPIPTTKAIEHPQQRLFTDKKMEGDGTGKKGRSE